MSSDFVHDGSAQYEQLEQQSVMEAIRSGGIDPARVYRTPSDEPGKKTRDFHFRLGKQLAEAVDAIVLLSGRYIDRSEALRQATVLFLACEREVADMVLPTEPVIIWAKQQTELSIQATIDEIIAAIPVRVAKIDGDQERDELLNDLMRTLDYCKSRGWNRRVEQVRQTLAMIRPSGID